MITSNQLLQELQLTSNVKYLIPIATAVGGGLLASHAHEVSSMRGALTQMNADIATDRVPDPYALSNIGNAAHTGAGALAGLALGSGYLGHKLSKEQKKDNLSNILLK